MPTVRGWILLAAALPPVLAATPAAAKMPFSSIRVRPDVLTVGEPVSVQVRFFWDEKHRRRADWFAPTWLALTPVDAAGRPVVRDQVPLRFEEVTPSRYVARVVPPHAGTWWIVSWPSNGIEPPSAPDTPGSTGTVAFRVQEPEPSAAPAPKAFRDPGTVLARAAGALLLACLALRLRRRRSAAAR